MAKQNFTQPTYVTNNNQAQPDEPSLSATAFKLLLDQVGIDTKAFLTSNLLVELAQGTLNDSGAHRIGLNTANTLNDNVADELDAIRQAGSGSIPPDGSITYPKLDTNLKATTDNTPLLASVASQALTVTIPLASQDKFIMEVPSDVSGGAITINGDPLELYDGTAVESLDAGYYDIVKEVGEYVLMSTPTKNGYSNSDIEAVTAGTFSVVGSGVLISVAPRMTGSTNTVSEIIIDGTDLLDLDWELSEATDGGTAFVGHLRFETGFSVTRTAGAGVFVTYAVD